MTVCTHNCIPCIVQFVSFSGILAIRVRSELTEVEVIHRNANDMDPKIVDQLISEAASNADVDEIVSRPHTFTIFHCSLDSPT